MQKCFGWDGRKITAFSGGSVLTSHLHNVNLERMAGCLIVYTRARSTIANHHISPKRQDEKEKCSSTNKRMSSSSVIVDLCSHLSMLGQASTTLAYSATSNLTEQPGQLLGKR